MENNSNNDNGNNCDVLVVGGGPTGLIACIFLRLHGVKKVRCIDMLKEASKWAKATATQHRSMEILKYAGGTVLEELYEHGTLARNMQINDYTTGEQLVSVQFPPFEAHKKRRSEILLNEQWHNEQVYAKRCEELGVSVERGKELKSLQDTGSHVEVTCKDGETFTTQFVVGCDGAHSFCRHHLGIPFVGEKFPRSYALIQAMVDDMPMDHGTIRVDLGANGWCFLSPMPDQSWICVFDLTDDERAQCSPNEPSLDDLVRLLAARGIKIPSKPHSPVWSTYFNVHSRQAEKYSQGRIFLCGDASHIHSPIGGQGMNMGIQDAHNLAWKLALVVTGQAGLPLLDSYDFERHNVDREVLKFVEVMNANVSTREALPRAFMNQAMKTLSNLQFVLDSVVVPRLGQQVYNYAISSLSVESWGRIPFLKYVILRRSQNVLRMLGKRLKAGDRVPDLELIIQTTIDADDGAVIVGEQVDLHQWFVQAGTGFKAIIFEGLSTHKLPNSDRKEPLLFAKALQKASCGLITGFAVVPNNNNEDVYHTFGVRGQCLFLIRPDGYIGLRLEPLSIDQVMSYFAHSVKATQVRGHGAINITGPDPIPYAIIPTILVSLGLLGHRCQQKEEAPTWTKVLGTVLVLYTCYTIVEVSRMWKK